MSHMAFSDSRRAPPHSASPRDLDGALHIPSNAYRIDKQPVTGGGECHCLKVGSILVLRNSGGPKLLCALAGVMLKVGCNVGASGGEPLSSNTSFKHSLGSTGELTSSISPGDSL